MADDAAQVPSDSSGADGGADDRSSRLRDEVKEAVAARTNPDQQPPQPPQQDVNTGDSRDPSDAGFTPTQRQIDYAKQLGLSTAEIEGLDEDTAKWVESLGRKYSKKMSEVGRLEQQLKSGQESKQTPPAGSTDDKAGDDGERKFTYKDWGEDSGLEAINQMADKITSLEARIAEMDAAHHDNEDGRISAERDRFFEALPAALKKRYGEGAVEDDTAESDARDELIDKAAVIQQGYIAAGHSPIPLSQALDEASKILDSDILQAQAATRKAEALRRRSSQRVTRPSNRDSGVDASGMDDRQKAETRIRNRARQKGIAV